MDASSRRQAPRIECDATFRGGGASKSLVGRVVDLSGTGLFLLTRKFVPVGTQIHLDFELSTGPVQAVGEVRWVGHGARGQGIGIRFLRLSAASARAIDDAIAAGGT